MTTNETTGAHSSNTALPIPCDFVALANVMSVTDLARHYGASYSRLYRWIKKTGVNPPKGYKGNNHNTQPMPDDFAALAPTMSKAELMRHYGVKWSGTIDRWLSLANTHAKPVETGRKPKICIWDRPVLQRSFRTTVERSHTVYDEAADVLRKYGPCYRCGPTGVFLEKGLHWRFGNTVMTGEDLLAKAERYRAKAA